MAIAIRASVTVSMAELTSGVRKRISLVAGGLHRTGDEIRGGRQQQHIIECEAEHGDLVRIVATRRRADCESFARYGITHSDRPLLDVDSDRRRHNLRRDG
jgi:hypothetical protein